MFAGACVASISRLQPSQAADGASAEAFGISIAVGIAGIAAILCEAFGVTQVPHVYTDNDAVAKLALERIKASSS